MRELDCRGLVEQGIDQRQPDNGRTKHKEPAKNKRPRKNSVKWQKRRHFID